jgi:hypothetical protein
MLISDLAALEQYKLLYGEPNGSTKHRDIGSTETTDDSNEGAETVSEQSNAND